IKAASEMLDTAMGAALISALLGHLLPHTPGLGEDPRVQKLAGEFRVLSMATAGNELFGLASEYLFPAIMEAVNKLPPISEVADKLKGKEEMKTRVLEQKRVVSPTETVNAETEKEEATPS